MRHLAHGRCNERSRVSKARHPRLFVKCRRPRSRCTIVRIADQLKAAVHRQSPPLRAGKDRGTPGGSGRKTGVTAPTGPSTGHLTPARFPCRGRIVWIPTMMDKDRELLCKLRVANQGLALSAIELLRTMEDTRLSPDSLRRLAHTLDGLVVELRGRADELDRTIDPGEEETTLAGRTTRTP